MPKTCTPLKLNPLPGDSAQHFETTNSDSEIAAICRRVQAQSYVAAGYVDANVLTSDGEFPPGVDHARGIGVTYYLLEKENGARATFRLIRRWPLSDLPSYRLLGPEGEAKNTLLTTNQSVVEVAALGTNLKGRSLFLEAVRRIVHETAISEESCFFCLASDAREFLVRHCGTTNFAPAGKEIGVGDEGVSSAVRLIPSIVDSTVFTDHIRSDLAANENSLEEKQLRAGASFFKHARPPGKTEK